MRLGIMQPYFFPYIGYWQLINAVDQYVVYDDIQFIKGGWINRNRILLDGQIKYFNVPMLGASPNKLINEISVNTNPKLANKNLRVIEGAYKKAPYFNKIFPLLREIICSSQENLAQYLFKSIQIICSYLDIRTRLILSSELPKDCSLKGQEKILTICRLLGASEYYNAIGGRELYDFKLFKASNIVLKFLKPDTIFYHQFDADFQENLSIIDIMMFNSKEQIGEMLNQYTLIEEL